MKPENLKTKIFLDSGDPHETNEVLEMLGFLDGQTTNPSLVAKNPKAQERFEKGEKFTRQEINDFYKEMVSEVSEMIRSGSISIEVYADLKTTAEEMLEDAREMFTWIPNSHIKFPTNKSGLEAAEQFMKEGGRVNMTLCFQQEQAAAVHCATKGGQKGDVFVSPFVGRLDDLGLNGMSLISNIMKMYQESHSHVEVLTASVRNIEHFKYALFLESDIITAPFKIIKEWYDLGMPYSWGEYPFDKGKMEDIPFNELDLSQTWDKFDITHELVDKGIIRFAEDWNKLIK